MLRRWSHSKYMVSFESIPTETNLEKNTRNFIERKVDDFMTDTLEMRLNLFGEHFV